jgi:hypothetical protein
MTKRQKQIQNEEIAKARKETFQRELPGKIFALLPDLNKYDIEYLILRDCNGDIKFNYKQYSFNVNLVRLDGYWAHFDDEDGGYKVSEMEYEEFNDIVTEIAKHGHNEIQKAEIEKKKAAALNKLTDEEKKILNLA